MEITHSLFYRALPNDVQFVVRFLLSDALKYTFYPSKKQLNSNK